MNENTVPRLQNVIRSLQESPAASKFTMSNYGHANVITAPDGHRCGTPACALGHYAYRTDLQDAFLLTTQGTMVRKNAGYESRNNYEALITTREIAEHFGINQYQADLLFGGVGCGGAKTVREAILFIQGFIAANTEACQCPMCRNT